MATVTVRPSGTVTNTGTLAGATPHGALSDDSDSTFVELNAGEIVTTLMGDVTLPAGSLVKQLAVRARVSATGPPGGLVASIAVPGLPQVDQASATISAGFATSTFLKSARSYTGTQVDAATVSITAQVNTIDVSETFMDVVYVAHPLVTVVGPTGTITTNQALVLWDTTLDTDGGPQVTADVRVFSAAQYSIGGFDPEASDAMWAFTVTNAADVYGDPTYLPDGDYRAYVRVAQVVNGALHRSDWAFSAFTVDAPQPNAPAVTVLAEDDEGRNRVTISSNGGTVAATAYELERSTDDGATWLPVRNRAGVGVSVAAPGAVTVIVYDYEAPNGREAAYRARAIHEFSADAMSVSVWSDAAFGTWASGAWWLKSLTQPALNRPVTLKSYGAVNRAARQGIFQPLGAVLPIVVSDTRVGASGQIVVRTETTVELDALDALLDATLTVLVQGPLDNGEPDRYVQVGSQAAQRLVENAAFHRRDVALSWVEVASPGGAIIGDDYTADEGMILL